jgi:C1A family cysteine protease
MYFGWIPDYPDARDYTRDTDLIAAILKRDQKPSAKIDLRKYCSSIVNQGKLGSCTANAASGIVEYFQKKTFGTYSNVSRLFIYKATRNLMRMNGDTGTYIRTTMGALALFGVPPEKYWEYKTEDFDKEPPSFCYSFAQNYQALKYFRLDEHGKTEKENLETIRETLATGIPIMFGFTVYSSIKEAERGRILFPEHNDRVLGGHAVMAVGYDDDMEIGKCTGAFIIRNSWGEEWGDMGYGYLPYEYVLKGLALDWWALVKAEWIDVQKFGV